MRRSILLRALVLVRALALALTPALALIPLLALTASHLCAEPTAATLTPALAPEVKEKDNTETKTQEDPFPDSVVVKITVAIVPESSWQKDLSPLPQEPAALLQKATQLAAEQQLPPPSEVTCFLLLGEEEKTFTSGGKTNAYPIGWEPPQEDPTSSKPNEELTRTLGTEVKIRTRHTGEDRRTQGFQLTLTHLFEEPASHPIVFGAMATSEAERLKLSVPLPIMAELQWSGEVTLYRSRPQLVANVLRHGSPATDHPSDKNLQPANSPQRCLIFMQWVPPQKPQKP